MAKCYLKGEWKKAGIVLQRLSATLFPLARVRLREDGEYILEVIKGHIDRQDLPWTPLTVNTVNQKGGSTLVYVNKGELKDGFVVRRLKNGPKDSTIFIGASPWKTHSSGLKYSELMLFLEYGTINIAPRPLMRPVREEVEGYFKDSFTDLMKDLLK